MNALPVDTSLARDKIEATLKAELSRLLDGTIDRLDTPIRDTANGIVVAARRGRLDILQIARNKLLRGLEDEKLEAREGLQDELDTMLYTGIRMLYSGLIAGLASRPSK